jgi:hypothetical protein
MEASGTVAKEQEIEFNALKGSLSMMSKGKINLLLDITSLTINEVLNDVLDLCVVTLIKNY